MLSLNRPGILILLLLLLPMIYYYHFSLNRGGRIRFAFQNWKGEGFRAPLWGVQIMRMTAIAFFWVGIALFIIALAEPVRIERERIYLNYGIEIMIILDESPSMAAQDFSPHNRFEASRSVIRDFILNRNNDAIGLVSFGDAAALRVPTTLDYQYVVGELDRLEIASLGDGTAIGMGIAFSILHLDRDEEKKKVLILITDGKNNAGEILPHTAAEIAAQLKIPIYIIGIGTDIETTLEFRDPGTGDIYRGNFEQGLDEELLRDVAAISGGAYFHASNNSALETIFQTINLLETVERRTRIQVNRVPLDHIFILLGFYCIMFDFIVRRFFLLEIF